MRYIICPSEIESVQDSALYRMINGLRDTTDIIIKEASAAVRGLEESIMQSEPLGLGLDDLLGSCLLISRRVSPVRGLGFGNEGGLD